MDKRQRRIALASVLADIRVRQGLSQSEVANALGKPQSYVSKFEAGQRRLDLQDLEDIAHALDYSLDNILSAYQESLQ